MISKTRVQVVPDVHLVLEDAEGRVLLLLRQNTGYADGQYGLVAGHLDGQETAREAMGREALEEAGLHIAPTNLELVHLSHRAGTDAPERLGLFFRATVPTEAPRNMEPDKCAGLHWFAWNALPETTIPYVRRALDQIKAGERYSEWGWEEPERGGSA